MNLPGHAIPYHFTDDEASGFLAMFASDRRVQSVLTYGLPEWGVVVRNTYGEILVYKDAAGKIHVVDVTNMAIAQRVNDARFESPDSSVVENVKTEVERLVKGLADAGGLTATWLPLVILGVLILKGSR